jgi:hypothetical protein
MMILRMESPYLATFKICRVSGESFVARGSKQQIIARIERIIAPA